MGLRERKKARTREALRAHALRLFEAQGYEATTLEQVAAAAEVSPRTLYRYFPTKEDLLVRDDYDPLLIRLLVVRPAAEPDLVAIRNALVEGLGYLDAEAEAAVAARTRMALGIPALEARMWAEQMRTAQDLAVALAERAGAVEPTLAHRVAAAGALSALVIGIRAWLDDGTREPLAVWVRRSLDALVAASTQ
jgi:AcrR family transcriptional regulator